MKHRLLSLLVPVSLEGQELSCLAPTITSQDLPSTEVEHPAPGAPMDSLVPPCMVPSRGKPAMISPVPFSPDSRHQQEQFFLVQMNLFHHPSRKSPHTCHGCITLVTCFPPSSYHPWHPAEAPSRLISSVPWSGRNWVSGLYQWPF